MKAFSISDDVSALEVQLQCCDFREYMSGLPEHSVDLFVSSPPYFIGKEYDSSLLVGDFEDVVSATVKEFKRVMKPGGSVCWQVGNHIDKGEILPLDFIVASTMRSKSDLKLRNRIVWTFAHGNHARQRFSGRHETVLWYTLGDDYFFDLDAVRVPQKYPGKRHYRGPKRGEFSGNPLGKNPGDFWEIGAVWDIPNVKANHIEKTEHPCQFPVSLVRRLVRALCPKGGTVLDPFVGSGTTAIAALLEGRSFRGCDVSERYFSIATHRIEDFRSGRLKIREDKPVHEPTGNEAVAKAPRHFKTL